MLRPLAPSCALSLLSRALSCSPRAPSMLPLKRPCSLSRPRTAGRNPKFGVYIMYIYIYIQIFLIFDFDHNRGTSRIRFNIPGSKSHLIGWYEWYFLRMCWGKKRKKDGRRRAGAGARARAEQEQEDVMVSRPLPHLTLPPFLPPVAYVL